MDAQSHKSESLSASRRCKSLNLRAFSPEECPSPPRFPRSSLPTRPWWYGNLRPWPVEMPVPTWTPPLPLEGYKSIFRRSQTAETLQTPLLPPPSIAIEEEGHSKSLAPPMPPPSLACEEDGLLPPLSTS